MIKIVELTSNTDLGICKKVKSKRRITNHSFRGSSRQIYLTPKQKMLESMGKLSEQVLSEMGSKLLSKGKKGSKFSKKSTRFHRRTQS
jgi:hypothetical protein